MEPILPSTSTPETSNATDQQTPTLDQNDILLAATNDPALARNEFLLGNRKFKVVFLKYKDYLVFLAKLKPLFELVVNNVRTSAAASELKDLDLASALRGSIDDLFTYCGEDLPALVALICRQTNAEVTPEWVIDVARSPFELAGIVMQQVALNDMIGDIGRFFKNLMPAMTKLKQTKSATSSTPQAK